MFSTTQKIVQQQVSVLSTSSMENRLGYHSKLGKNVMPLTEQTEDFKEQVQPYQETVVADIIKIQQVIFPQVMSNIEKTQEKQKR